MMWYYKARVSSIIRMSEITPLGCLTAPGLRETGSAILPSFYEIVAVQGQTTREIRLGATTENAEMQAEERVRSIMSCLGYLGTRSDLESVCVWGGCCWGSKCGAPRE